MDVKEFIENIVKIDLIESENTYGHYPFQLFVETSDGSFKMNALMLGGDVLSCYRRVREYVREDAKEIYLSLDFPKGKDMVNDFVCIFTIKEAICDIFAIPYDPETGKTFDIITKSILLDEILDNFKHIVLK